MSLNQYYDKLDHSSAEAFRNTITKALAKASLARKGKALDLGCGNGDFSLRLAKVIQADEIYGVDVSENIREVSRSSIKAYKVNLNFEKLPFPHNFFDVVFAVELIEHLLNPDNMLSEAYRVLSPDGVFLLSTPNLASGINRLLILMGYMPYFSEPSLRYCAGILKRDKKNSNPSGHLRLYTLKAVKELLQFYSFKALKFYGSNAGYKSRALKIVDVAFSKTPSLASGIIVLAKK